MKARTGFWWIAATLGLADILGWVTWIGIENLRSKIWSSLEQMPFEEFQAEWTVLINIQGYGQVAIGTAVCVGLLVLAPTLIQHRRLARSAFGLVALGLLMDLVVMASLGGELSADVIQTLSVGAEFIWGLGCFLIVVIAAGHRKNPFAQLGLPSLHGLLILIALGIRVMGLLEIMDPELLGPLFRFFSSGSVILAMAVCTWAGVQDVAEASNAHQGRPLRALGWLVIARVSFGVLSTVLLGAGMSLGSDIGVVLQLAAGIGVLLAALTCIALGMQFRWPNDWRRPGALLFAIVSIMVMALMELWSSRFTVELLDLITQAKSATSIWNIPSISRIKELQSTVMIGSRITQGLSLLSILAILSSLERTATYLEDLDSLAMVGRTKILVVVGTVAALGLSFALPAAPSSAVMFLALAAFALLVVAVLFLIQLHFLLFALAKTVEEHSINLRGPEET